jgi:DNA-binding MarR family transcriptional regulator
VPAYDQPVAGRRPIEPVSREELESRPHMHVLFDLNAAHNVSETFVEVVLGGSPLADGFALLSLIGGAGSITPTAAAARLGLPVTTASDKIRRLEERGLVERRPNPADRRSHLVSLTPAGQKAWERTFDGWAAAIERLRDELEMPQAEIAAAIRELDRAMRSVLSADSPKS